MLTFVAGLAIGCTPKATLHLTDGASVAIIGARVERYRPAFLVEKIVNPIGTFYHPNTLAEKEITDCDGRVVIGLPTEGGYYMIYAGANQKITVQLGDTFLVGKADSACLVDEVGFDLHPPDIPENWVYFIKMGPENKMQATARRTSRYPLPNQASNPKRSVGGDPKRGR